MHVTPILFVCKNEEDARHALQLQPIFDDPAIQDDVHLAQARLIQASALISRTFTHTTDFYAAALGFETGIYIGFHW